MEKVYCTSEFYNKIINEGEIAVLVKYNDSICGVICENCHKEASKEMGYKFEKVILTKSTYLTIIKSPYKQIERESFLEKLRF